MKYLKRERLLHDEQYGFVPGRSTTFYFLKVLDEWTEVVDRGKEVDVVYLEFRKAFDSVPHLRIINILEQYGIRARNLQWIEQFLKSREQLVLLNQAKSLWHAVVSVVPQCPSTFSFICQLNARHRTLETFPLCRRLEVV